MARALLAMVLIVLLVPLVLAANAAIWVSRTVVDAPTFTGSVDRALDAPAVDALLTDRATRVVVAGLDRLDPLVRAVAVAALGLAPDPPPAQLQLVVEERVSAVLETSIVRDARTDGVIELHTMLTTGDGDAGGWIVVIGDQVLLDVRPVVLRALDTVDPRLADLVLSGPGSDATRVELTRVDGLERARAGIRAMDAAAVTLIVVAVMTASLAVVVARDRVGAVGWVGMATATAGVLALTVAWLAGDPIAAAADDDTVRGVVAAVYGPLTEPLRLQSVVLVLAGAVLIVIGWMTSALLGRRRAG